MMFFMNYLKTTYKSFEITQNYWYDFRLQQIIVFDQKIIVFDTSFGNYNNLFFKNIEKNFSQHIGMNHLRIETVKTNILR